MATPKENLDMRLASGEISLEDYKKILAVLEENTNPRPTRVPQPIFNTLIYEKPKKLDYLFLLYVMLGIFPFLLAVNVKGNHLSSVPFEYGGAAMLVNLFFLLVLNIVYIVCFSIFIYRIWKAMCGLMAGQSNPTPGKAVGFLFIPLFNLYWIFVVFQGFWNKLEKLLKSHEELHKYILPFNPGLVLCFTFIAGGVLSSIVSVLVKNVNDFFIRMVADFIYIAITAISLLVPIIFILLTGWIFNDVIKVLNLGDKDENRS